MISFMKPGYVKVLRLFYLNKSGKMHLREISRNAGLHGPSTTKILIDLETEGLLKSEKEGNQKKYSLKLNYKTYFIFELFDLERLNRLPNIRRNALNYFISCLKEKPIIAFVFGSTAKDNFKKDSDIDLLIVTNSKLSTAEAEKHAEALTGLRISIFQIPLKSFLEEIKLKEDPVVQSAITSGYPIFNHLYYYEALYNGY